MARFGGPWTSGKWGAEGLTRLIGKLLSGSGVLASGDFLVAAQTTPDMTVKVAIGDTAVMDGAIVRHGWSTAVENVNIASNATGVTKTDVVVAYLDSTAASTTENNPNALVLASVRKPSGTGVPSGAEIIAIIGAKPYTILAEVTVGNGVTSINSGNIVDRRAVVGVNKFGAVSFGAVGNISWNSASVSSHSTTLKSGSAGNGVYQTTLTLNLASMAIPSTALILQYEFWFNPADNSSGLGTVPVAVVGITRSGATHSIELYGQAGITSGTFPNLSNSRVDGYVRYINIT